MKENANKTVGARVKVYLLFFLFPIYSFNHYNHHHHHHRQLKLNHNKF